MAGAEFAGTFTVVGKVTIAGTLTMPGGAAAVLTFVACAAGGSPDAPERMSTHTSTAMFTTSSAPSAYAHTGRLRRGAATFTSNRAGVEARWRSVSDFLRASRMKDMSAACAGAVATQEGCGGIVERGIERDLGLHAGDAIDREPVLALEFLDHAGERGVVALGLGRIGDVGGQAVHAPQAFAQPAYARVLGAERERLRASRRGSPEDDVVAEPAAREVADADFALRATEVHLR